jgi:hypothetical protein
MKKNTQTDYTTGTPWLACDLEGTVTAETETTAARLTPYYKVLQDAVRCYLVMLHCSDCNGYKALATGYNTK